MEDTVGEIIIERVTNLLTKYISKGTIEVKFSPDVGNNPSNSYMQRNETIGVLKLSYM